MFAHALAQRLSRVGVRGLVGRTEGAGTRLIEGSA
jgi:hypothetical protein